MKRKTVSEISRRKSIYLSILVIGTAGCHITEPTWSLTISPVDEQEVNDGIEIVAGVGLNGNPNEGVTVADVTVCAVDEEGTVMDTETIEQITPESLRTSVSLRVDEPPSEIVVGNGLIETEQEYSLQGMNRKEDGGYSSFYQDGPRCGD